MVFDVIIIGAGAAGLFAATVSAERGKKVLLLEKNAKIGVKILMSGGTRCNITQNTDSAGIAEGFRSNGKFLRSALARLTPSDVVQWVESEGVDTKIELTGKIFPVSDRAVDVRNAILDRLKRSPDVLIRNKAGVTNVECVEGNFRVSTPEKQWSAKKLILASGGKSYPGCGTTGDGYQWAIDLGHTLVPTAPALTPLVSPEQWVKDLSGLSIDPCLVGVFEKSDLPRISAKNFSKLAITSSRSSLLFTHFGCSGPAAMNVSREFAYRPQGNLTLVVDFLPDENLDSLRNWLLLMENQAKVAQSALAGKVPSRLLHLLVQRAGIAQDQRLAEIKRLSLQKLLGLLKGCPVAIEGVRGYKKAEVTAGGVNLKEVNSQSMESKICSGLYFAGEILDLDGPIGGFNFQSAFSTGYLAGLSI